MSADGTAGDAVTAQLSQPVDNEKNTIAGAYVCGGTDVVDGNTTNCPFADGSGLNTLYEGYPIIQLYSQTHSDDAYLYCQAATDYICQGSMGATGYEWVEVDSGNDLCYLDCQYLINVRASDDNDASYHACDDGVVGDSIHIQSTWAGQGQCEWQR